MSKLGVMLRNEPDAMRIISHYLALPEWKQEKFWEKIEMLCFGGIRVSSVEFPEDAKPINDDGELLVSKGSYSGKQWQWTCGDIRECTVKREAFKLTDRAGTFSVLYEIVAPEVGNILLAEIPTRHQGRGRSKLMLAAMRECFFQHHGFERVLGRAAIPKDDCGVAGDYDWRMEEVEWRGVDGKSPPLTITRLLRFWLSQEGVVRGPKVFQELSEDSFVIRS